MRRKKSAKKKPVKRTKAAKRTRVTKRTAAKRTAAKRTKSAKRTVAKRTQVAKRAAPRRMAASGSRDLLYEIGVEELPSTYVPPALAQLEKDTARALTASRLSFTSIATFGTPRRLVLQVRGLSARQTDHSEVVRGPAVRAAYDGEGKPTRALLGFCQSKGLDPNAVRKIETEKGAYIEGTVDHPGRSAIEVLPGILAPITAKLQFPKAMRWLADPDTRFARPVRWLVALYGKDVVPVKVFELEAGRISFGHRFLDREPVKISDASAYVKTLKAKHVIVQHDERATKLARQIDALAKRAGGRVVADPELLEINNFLVEWPTAFLGEFDKRYLELPSEVIVTALREHQRFFAVENRKGKLLPYFIAVRNGDAQGLAQVRRGNQDVLTARLEDAQFYWETDTKTPPAELVDALSEVVWMEGLGSLKDKAGRLESLTGWLSKRMAPEASKAVRRAALLCKTDLMSEMIGSGKEYTSLEGIIGGHYARRSGESEAVAAAIGEHYLPRGAGDDLPQTDAGAILSLADKLDHVGGAFVARKIPTGSEDPYGVRRAGNGVVRILIEQERHLDLQDASVEATRVLFAADPELPHGGIIAKLGHFWRDRVATALDEHGIPYDTRDAALDARIEMNGAGPASKRAGYIDPCDCLKRAEVLAGFRGDRRFEPLVVLFKRVSNILKAAKEAVPDSLDRERLEEAAERELMSSLEQARERSAPLWNERAYGDILPALLDMESTIHGFFDKVLVNAEDMPTRLNRLRLLTEVRELFVRGWDLSRVVVEGEKS